MTLDNQNIPSVDVDYTSAPADPDNPAFDSLLDALRAHHEGEIGLDVLKTYHTELSKQLQHSRSNIQAMEVAPESQETKDISLGALTTVQDTIDRLDDYIREQNPQTLADCVSSLLNSKGQVAYVHKILDENIASAGIE